MVYVYAVYVYMYSLSYSQVDRCMYGVYIRCICTYMHTLSYPQVDRVIRALEERQLRPLVIMHCRHFAKNVNMSAADEAMVQRWRDKKVLYTTPPKMNDDWFWLYAGVWRSAQRGGASLVMV